MKETTGIKPTYDERVNEILDGLKEGISRDELAEKFGHKNYKTLDIYMRRRNFTWNSIQLNYVPKLGPVLQTAEKVLPTSKAGTVIEMMKQPKFDIEEICKKNGFTDHRQLADYMTIKGYVWSATDSRYIKKHGRVEEKHEEPKSKQQDLMAARIEPVEEFTAQSLEELSAKIKAYLPILKWLEINHEKLQEIIEPAVHSGTLPRYIVPGRASGKTIQMSEVLQDMSVTFCNERGIKQRELFEIALIEFFKHNGYEYEVANLMQSYS